ncbi:MAG: ABC transporter substrate-binding protein [Candidatus Dormibacteraceae bacterium]
MRSRRVAKRPLSALWGLALAIVIAACGSAGAPTGTTTTPGQSKPDTPVGKFSGKTVNLLRWAGDPWTAATKDAASRWDAATGGQLTVGAIPYENLETKEALALSSGTGSYDILYVHPGWFGQFAKAGYLQGIGGYLSDAGMNPSGFSTSDYIPAIFKQGSYNGKQYCLQDQVSTILVAYRKDLYQKYNLKAPTSWDDLLNNAKVLNAQSGMAGLAIPGKAIGDISDVMSSLLTGEGTWWYDSHGKAALDVAKTTQAIQFYVNASKYSPSGMLNMHYDDVTTAAAQGKAAQLITLSTELAWLNDPSKSKTVGDWAYAPLAYNGKAGGELIYWNWCIAAGSKNPKAAYSFLQWYTSTPEQAKIAPVAATGGATKGFYADQSLTQSLPFLPAMQQALANSNPQPSLAQWPQLQDKIEHAVQSAISGSTSPAQAAQEISQQLRSTLGT